MRLREAVERGLDRRFRIAEEREVVRDGLCLVISLDLLRDVRLVRVIAVRLGAVCRVREIAVVRFERTALVVLFLMVEVLATDLREAPRRVSAVLIPAAEEREPPVVIAERAVNGRVTVGDLRLNARRLYSRCPTSWYPLP